MRTALRSGDSTLSQNLRIKKSQLSKAKKAVAALTSEVSLVVTTE